MRKFLMLSVLLATSLCAAAQNSDAEERYRQAVKEAFNSYAKFRSQAESSYQEFRQKANAEYATFLGKAWKSFSVSPAPVKPTPDPPVQPSLPQEELDELGMEDSSVTQPQQEAAKPVVTPQQNGAKAEIKPLPKSQPQELNYGKVMERPTVQPQPQPKVPITEPKVLTHKSLQIDFFGTQQSVRVDATTRHIHVSSSEESSVVAAWREASDGRYDLLLNDCLTLCKELALCDWGYYMLLRAVTKVCYGNSNSNNAKLLQAYLLVHSGYKLRLARASGM